MIGGTELIWFERLKPDGSKVTTRKVLAMAFAVQTDAITGQFDTKSTYALRWDFGLIFPGLSGAGAKPQAGDTVFWSGLPKGSSRIRRPTPHYGNQHFMETHVEISER